MLSFAKALDLAQANRDGMAFLVGLNGGNKWRLAGGTASALTAPTFAAQVGIIHLDSPDSG